MQLDYAAPAAMRPMPSWVIPGIWIGVVVPYVVSVVGAWLLAQTGPATTYGDLCTAGLFATFLLGLVPWVTWFRFKFPLFSLPAFGTGLFLFAAAGVHFVMVFVLLLFAFFGFGGDIAS